MGKEQQVLIDEVSDSGRFYGEMPMSPSYKKMLWKQQFFSSVILPMKFTEQISIILKANEEKDVTYAIVDFSLQQVYSSSQLYSEGFPRPKKLKTFY